MGQALHLEDFAVDQTSVAGLCGQYQVRELSIFGSDARGEMRPDRVKARA
jgi:predicted nucleotidyltransferase